MKKLSLIAGLFCLTACNRLMPMPFVGSLQQNNIAVPGNANIPIIIVAGQSNAVGQGDTTVGHVPGLDWRGGGYERGIGEYVGEAYLQHTNRPEAIILQCAVGGTSISQWATGGTLDTQCQMYLQDVMTEFPNAKVATILFWQGEADTTLAGTSWAAQFSSIVRAWRSQYGNIPIEFCQLAYNNSSGFPYWGYIQAQQASVSLPGVTMTVTQDVGDISADGLHMTFTGLEIVGERLSRAYFSTIGE